MSEIRQLLRYEIPGLLVFIYTFIMIAPFIEKSALKELMEILPKLFIALAIIALPVGWLIYQLYEAYFYSRISKYNHYTKPSVLLLEEWSPEFISREFISREKIKNRVCEELENFFFFYEKNKKLKDNLIIYWNYYHARMTSGIFVPCVSFILSISSALFLKSNYEYLFVGERSNILAYISIVLIIFIFSLLVIYKPTTRIRNEVDTLECLLLLNNKKVIVDFCKDNLNEPYFQDFENKLLKNEKKTNSPKKK